MTGWKIGPVGPGDVPEVTRIHCVVLSDGFLARLGPRVLGQIYSAAFGAPGALGLAARRGPEIGAFLLATSDTGALFRHVLRRRAVPLGLSLLGAVIRRPRLLRDLVDSIRYPAKRGPLGAGHVADAELISIAVLPPYRSKGFGTAMIEALNREFAGRRLDGYTVSVYSSNERGNAFYRRLGFEFLHEFRMYDRPWSLYRLRLADTRAASAKAEGLEDEGERPRPPDRGDQVP